MAIKRYKAGTIFLDVAPSFKGVQDATRKEVQKVNRWAKDEAEKAGLEEGEARGKAAAKAEEKVAKEAADRRISLNKEVNNQIIRDDLQMVRAIDKISKKALDDREKLEQQMALIRDRADARARKRRTEELKRERDAQQKARVAAVKYEQETANLIADARQKALEKSHAEALEEDRRFNKKRAEEYEAAFAALLKEEQDAIDLANAMADGREKAHADRIRQMELEGQVRERERVREEKAEKAQIAAWARQGREMNRLHAEALRINAQLDREAAAEQRILDREAAKERRELLRQEEREQREVARRSGGRIGRLIKKSVGAALDDLPMVKLTADSGPVDRSIADIRSRLLALRDARIGIDISADDAKKEVTLLSQMLKGLARHHDGTVRINALAALASLKALDDGIDSIKDKARKPLVIRIIQKVMGRGSTAGRGVGGGAISDDGANAFRAFNPLILAVVTSLSMIGPVAAVAAAGLVTLAGTAISAASGFGVLVLAFQGVFQAIQDQIKAEDDAALKSDQSAKRRMAAARQVRDAQERLADAEVDAAQASEDAARRVADAQRGLADARQDAARSIEDALERQREAEERVRDAQDSAANAQRNLNEARRDAKREIEDLALAYRGAKLDEQEARIGIIQAQERLSEVRRRAWKGDASWADVRDAELGVQQARLRAEESTVRRRRAGADSSAASKAGVEGNERVRDARDSLDDALASQERAQRALERTSRDVAETRVKAARQIRDAERAVTDALREQARTAERSARSLRDAKQGLADAHLAAAEAADETLASAEKANQSMRDLSKEGQSFARFILSLRGGYKELRDLAAAGVLPGLEKGMRQLGIYGTGFRAFVRDMAKVWGDSFEEMGRELTQPQWRDFFATMGRDAPKQAGLFNRALMNVAETVAGLLNAFSPLTTEMLTWLAKATAGWAEWANGLKGSPGFERFLEYVRRVAPEVKDFFIALGKAAIALGIALAPFGEALINLFTNVFLYISEMDPKVLGFLAGGLISLVISLQLGSGALAGLTSLFNPFHSGLSAVVTLVVLAGLALLHFYNTNEDVRRVVDRLLVKLREFGAWLWEHRGTVIKFVGALMGFAAIAKLVVVFRTLKTVLVGAMGSFGRVAGLLSRVTMLFNPWVLAIGLVIAAIVYLWKTNDGFRDGVLSAWEKIKAGVAVVVDWFVTKGLPALKAVFSAIGKALSWLWENVVKPVFRAWVKAWTTIFKAMKVVWEYVLWPVLKVIGAAFKLLWAIAKPIIVGLWENMKVAFTVIAWLWKNILSPILRKIGEAFMNRVGKPAKKMWEHFIKPAFEAFRKNADTLAKGISDVADWITKRWAKIEGGMTKPLREVVKWINKHFITNINKLLKKIGVEWQIPLITLGGSKTTRNRGSLTGTSRAGGVTAYAAGGRVRDPRGPVGTDTILGISPMTGAPTAWVDHDEMVVRRSSTRKMDRKHPGLLDYINIHGDLPGLAIGGRTSGLNKEFLRRLGLFNAAAGNRYSVSSGYRSLAEQTILWNRSDKTGRWVAPPGRSNHNFGIAADLSPGDAANVHGRLAGPRGLKFPMDYEPWHIEPIGISRRGIAEGGGVHDWIAKALSAPMKWAKDKVKSLLSKIPGQGSLPGELAKGTFMKFSDVIGDKLTQFAEGDALIQTESDVAGGVSRWRPTVLKALSILGLSDKYANATLRQIHSESSGNPRAINLTDINARRGDPSKGLLQVIGETFRRYAHPDYNKDIYDPLSNILASMRYAKARYGNLFNAYKGRAYATGTDSAAPGWALVGEEGPELVRFQGREQVYNRQQTMRLAALGAQGRGEARRMILEGDLDLRNGRAYISGIAQEVVNDNDSFKESVGRWRNG